jgi:hypothetical protein
MRAPFTVSQLDERFPNVWTAAKKFGLVQYSKIRQIDVFSPPGVNAAYGTRDKISLSGIDEIAAIIVSVLTYMKNQSQTLPPGWLVGRNLDLKAAYKQLAVDPGPLHLSIFALKRPAVGEVGFFVQHVLPFGATAAV